MAQPRQRSENETTNNDSRNAPPSRPPSTGRGRAGLWVLPILVLVLLGTSLLWRGGWGGVGFGSGTSVLFLVLFLLVCPVSMYFMMRGMGDMNRRKRQRRDDEPHNGAH